MNKRYLTPLLAASALALVLGVAHISYAGETPSCVAAASCAFDEAAAMSDEEMGGLRGGDNTVTVTDSNTDVTVDSYNTYTTSKNDAYAENSCDYCDIGPSGNVYVGDHSQTYATGMWGQILNTGSSNNLIVQNGVSMTFQ